MYRVASHCDVFQHISGAQLVANSGVLRPHLTRLENWELILPHVAMPTYAKAQISKQGIHFDRAVSARFVGWYN
jgi:hypothetical protein